MRTKQLMIVMVLAAAFAVPALGDDSSAMATASEVGAGSLATITWQMDEGAGPQNFSAMGVCVSVDSDGKGTLMAAGMNPTASAEDFQNIQVRLPGAHGAVLEASLQGVDPLTSLGFVRVEEAHDWKPARFLKESGLTVGSEVVSVGLAAPELGRVPYVGKAFVCAALRTPDKIFMVSGGELTEAGSLVLNGEGSVVGLVGQQMWEPQQMILQRQAVTVPMRGRQWTNSFLPVDEFASVLERIPASPDQVAEVPWLGALRAEAVAENLWEGEGLSSPGVKLFDIVPGYPAELAGLTENDIIIAINGELIEHLATPDMTANQMNRNIGKFEVGTVIELTFIRNRKADTTMLTLTAWPQRPGQAPRFIDAVNGMRVREKVELDQYLDKTATANVAGIIVIEVAPNSPADRAGLRQGDVITSVGGESVRTVEVYQELMTTTRETTTTNSIDILIRRGDQDKAISIRTN